LLRFVRETRYLHSFPTRRSSDLGVHHDPIIEYGRFVVRVLGAIGVDGAQIGQVASRGAAGLVKSGKKTNANNNFATARVPALARSEEHTSELQSRENLVCRLLLE